MEVKKIEIHHYTLTPKQALNRLTTKISRAGVLLRITFEGLPKPGHADLFPWPELGDLPLGLQLETLREGTPLPLVAASLLWAHEEAKALSKDEAFFPGNLIPSHYTCTDRSLLDESKTLVKLKINAHDIANWKEIETLFERFPDTKWRLDFNGLFHVMSDAHDFWQTVSNEAKEKIEFLEDPVTESLMGHQALHDVFSGATIALDRSTSPTSIGNTQVRVLKPITFAPDVLLSEAKNFLGKVVVTSSMDHPLGQLIALRGAQLIQKHAPGKLLHCGLVTQDLYEPHFETNWVSTQDDCLIPTHVGPGWGLEKELSSLKWEILE